MNRSTGLLGGNTIEIQCSPFYTIIYVTPPPLPLLIAQVKTKLGVVVGIGSTRNHEVPKRKHKEVYELML